MLRVRTNKKCLLFLLTCLSNGYHCVAELEWRLVDGGEVTANINNKPEPRRDAALGVTQDGNTIVLFGGRGGSGNFNSTWLYHLDSKTWELVDHTAVWPQPKYSMVYGMSGHHFYTVTGQGTGGDNGLFNDVWVFDVRSKTWRDLSALFPSLPEPRYGCGGGLFNHSHTFYLSHGFSSERRFSDVWRFQLPHDPASTQVASGASEVVYEDRHPYGPTYPHSRCLVGWTAVSEDEFAIYGGCASGGATGGPCPSWDSWIYRDSSRDWKQLPNCASPRIYPSMSLLVSGAANKLVPILYGGNEDVVQILNVKESDESEVAVLDVDTNDWHLKRAVAPDGGGTLPTKRYGSSLTSDFGGKVYMFGGRAVSDGKHLNDLWVLSGDPLSAADQPDYGCGGPFISFFTVTMLHVIFMFIAWSIFLPTGIFIARYFKSRDPLWFKLHRGIQVAGILFAIAGFVCAIKSFALSDHFNFFHGGLGLCIMVLGLQQPLNAVIRPHKDKDQPPARSRMVWELWHKNAGRIAILLAVVQTSMGLFLEVASIGTVVAWYVYVVAWILLVLIFEFRLRKSSSAGIVENLEL